MALTDKEKTKLANDAHTALSRAKTKKEVMEVWSAHYLTLGHKILGRLLIGQTVEQALRLAKEK